MTSPDNHAFRSPKFRKRLSAFAAVVVVVITLPTRPSWADPPLQVAINSCASTAATVTGFIGTSSGGPVRQFLGIPFAGPPTGKNRWQPPKIFCWAGNRDAFAFASTCPQPDGTGAEDCLYLNIYTPTTRPVSKLPVMVFIHGGGLVGGAGSIYNLTDLVNRDVIVVTINYRLGALGFLAHPALDKVSTKNTGMYGILDQQAALKWVKDNISKFGGNSKNVTIFGQSAGGLSVLVHLVSPLSSGLFHKAILQSGPIYFQATLADAESRGTTFATQAGCGSQKASCLRSLPVSAIVANQGVLGDSPDLIRLDQVVLKDTMMNLLMSGKFQRVPIINGTTHDEARLIAPGDDNLTKGNACHLKSKITPANYAGLLPLYYTGNAPAAVAQQYPPGSTDLSANVAFYAALTDRKFACHALHMDIWIAQNGGKIYAYEFNDRNAPPILAPVKLADGTVFPFGAYHAADLQYFSDAGSTIACGLPYAGLSLAQQKLAAAMVTYWTTFASTGDPNPVGGTHPSHWPQYHVSGGQMLSLVAGKPKAITADSFDTDHKCTAMWFTFAP